jgi:branched-chain amino acid transport system permease protein
MGNQEKKFLGRSSKILMVLGMILLLLPSFLGDYPIHVFILIFFFAYLGQCWNILGGYAGQISLGHATYFGVGAYISTLLFIHWGLTPWVGMFLGAFGALIFGLFTGYLCFRFGLKGPYFALATLAFTEILRLISLNMMSIGGASGLLVPLAGNKPFLFQFTEKKGYYYIIFAMMVLSILIVRKIEKSKMGFYFKSIHENEDAAEALGIDTQRYKLIAIGISSFLTAFGGTFYAQYLMYIQPDLTFGPFTSVEILLRAIIGGMGTVYGPVLGAFILTPLSEVTRTLIGGKTGVHIMIFGAILMFVCIYMQRGVLPWLRAIFREKF